MTYNGFMVFLSDLAGIRTQDPLIKSQMLYQLSYQIIFQQTFCPSADCDANVGRLF